MISSSIKKLQIEKNINFYEILKSILTKLCSEESLKIKYVNEFENYSSEFREKVSAMYKTTPHVLKSKIEDEFFIQNNVKFLLKNIIVDEFDKKVIAIGDRKGKNESKSIDLGDPFAPPFNEGKVLEEDFGQLGTHRIFFSKFAVMEEHLLLVTRDFISQYTHLSLDDIKNTILLMNIMDGIAFFNGGKNSGASQPRKHLQCIPFKSMYNKDFGIFLLISDKENLCEINLNTRDEENEDGNARHFSKYFKLYNIKVFSESGINHILIKFSETLSYQIKQNITKESLKLHSEIIHCLYNIGLNYLDLLEDEENIIKHYSFLLTSEWMFITPRKTHLVNLTKGTLNINSIGFILSFLIRNPELNEEVKEKNILKDIFSEL